MTTDNKANGGNIWIPGSEGQSSSRKKFSLRGDLTELIETTIVVALLMLVFLFVVNRAADIQNASMEKYMNTISEPSQIINKSETGNSFVLEIGDDDTNSSKTEKVTVSEDVYRQLDVGEYYKRETSTE
jgi:preprotein translocase subunit YajC